MNILPHNLELFSIVIPARNEENCITQTILNLHNELKNNNIIHEIIVVNDGSIDNTEDRVKELKNTIKELKIINNNAVHGFGAAVRCGLNNITGDAVTIYMADECDNPKNVIQYWNELKLGYDCVFGSRFIKNSKIIDYPIVKLIFNRIFNKIIQIVFNISYNDVTNAFKAYTVNVINNCCPLISNDFNLTVELPLKAIIRNYQWSVIPITWTNRKHNTSKFHLKKLILKYLLIFLYILIEKNLMKKEK